MHSRQISYTDGTSQFLGDLYWDNSRTGPRPGIVVFPEAFGLNEHARERARRLAALGYVALAADLHGGAAQIHDMAALGPRMQGLYGDRAAWRALATSALDALVAQPETDGSKTAAIGFCFGGTTAIELARSGAPLSAVVTFHAGLLPEQEGDAGQIRAKILVCHGAEDPLVQPEVINAVMAEWRRDRVDWQFTYYGRAAHSFTSVEADSRGMAGLAYDACTDARAWAALVNFFGEALA